MKKTTTFLPLILALLLGACSTPKNFNYLQDIANGAEFSSAVDGQIRLQPGDQISILVKSKDPLTASLFNKGLSTNLKAGQADGSIYMSGYTVGPDGTIDFPVVGSIKVEGLTRNEVERCVKNQLTSSGLLKDANVTTEFMNLSYTITGEVNKPGVYRIEKDALTLLEAIGNAGDLGIYGKRDSVMVVREQGGHKKAYVLSLASAKDLFASEAYYVRQNDVIYVKANDVKARQSTANGTEIRSFSLWLSLASVLASIAVLIVK